MSRSAFYSVTVRCELARGCLVLIGPSSVPIFEILNNQKYSMKLSKALAWGIIFIMCLNSMSLHFDENRTLATQIGTLGTSVGQFAFPVIITPLVAAYSLKV